VHHHAPSCHPLAVATGQEPRHSSLQPLCNRTHIAVAITVSIVLRHCLHQGCRTLREPTTGTLTTVHSSGLRIHAVCHNLVVAPVIAATPDRIAPLIARIALFNALPAPLHPSVDRVATPLPVFTVVGDPDSASSRTVQLVVAPCSTVRRYQCVPQARASTSFARSLVAAPVIAATQSRTTHTQLQI